MISLPQATVLITTHNRKDILARSIQSTLHLSDSIEVFVIDDCSDDGTEEMIKTDFPHIRYLKAPEKKGYIHWRNIGIKEASAEIVISIDDDAYFQKEMTLESILTYFYDPLVAALALPYQDILISDKVRQQADPGKEAHLSFSFRGTAFAIRKECFLKAGSFRECLVHQGEENDLAIRLINMGYKILKGASTPVIHEESPNRDTGRMDYYGRRNDVLFVFFNVPLFFLIPHLLLTSINGLKFGLREKKIFITLKGLLAGYIDGLKYCFKYRQAVKIESYRKYRKLKKEE